MRERDRRPRRVAGVRAPAGTRAMLPTARVTPMATSAMPAWCSVSDARHNAGGEQSDTGREHPEAACPSERERIGAPSATGSSWYSAPKIVVVSQPSVKRCVTPATCGDGYAPVASSGAIHTSPAAPATQVERRGGEVLGREERWELVAGATALEMRRPARERRRRSRCHAPALHAQPSGRDAVRDLREAPAPQSLAGRASTVGTPASPSVDHVFVERHRAEKWHCSARPRRAVRPRDRRRRSCSRRRRAPAPRACGTSRPPCAPRRRRRADGWVTTTAPESTTACARLSGTSPVPGGRSTTSTSSSGHATPRANCFTAFETIGPRQIAGDPSPRKKPKLISGSPCASSGRMCFSGDMRTRRAPSSMPSRIGQARSVDVGVEQTGAQPFARESEREVHRDGALSDAALSRAHGDDVPHRGEPHLFGPGIGVPRAVSAAGGRRGESRRRATSRRRAAAAPP